MTDKTKGKAAIYVRVSTDEQNPEHQVKELKTYVSNKKQGLYKVYRDIVSGSKSTRPGLMEMLKDAKDKKFTVVYVWKLDRLGRSLQHLVKLCNYFDNWGIDFVCTSQGIDTTSASGRLVFHIMGALAEFERELISERTKLGLKNAKNVGKRGKDKGQRKKGGYYNRYQKKGTHDFNDLDLL